MFYRATITLGAFFAIMMGIGATLIDDEGNQRQRNLPKGLNNDCCPLQVCLSIPGIGGLIDDQRQFFSKLFISQNVDANKLFQDPNDPSARIMVNSTEEFNAFYKRFNYLIKLGNAVQMENELDPLLRNGVENFLTRQIKETRWLAKVVSHRMKLIGIHKKLWLIYKKLQSNEEIDSDELESMRESVDDLKHSEERLKQKTHNLILYVLKN